MPPSQHTCSAALGHDVLDNQTRYFPLVGLLTNADPLEELAVVETREAGGFAKLFANVPGNTASGTTSIAFRVDGAYLGPFLSVPGDATGEFEDLTNVATVDADAQCCYEVQVPSEAGTNTLTLSVLGVVFTPTDPYATVGFVGASGANFTTASTTRFVQFYEGVNIPIGNEANAEIELRGFYVARNLAVYVSANARTTPTVFETYTAADGDGDISVSFAASETGVKEDATNVQAFGSGTRAAFAVVTDTGSGTLTVGRWSLTLEGSLPTQVRFPLFAAAGGGTGFVVAFGTLAYLQFGSGKSSFPTETSAQLLSRTSFVARELTVNVSDNARNGACPITFRVDGGDGVGAVTYAGGETGVKSAPADVGDVITAGLTRYDVEIDATAGAVGAITFRSFAVSGHPRRKFFLS